MYRKIETKRGIKWLKDGRFISEKDVPQKVKEAGSGEKEVLNCLFCSQLGDHARSLLIPQTKEQKIVKLCYDHYYEKSLGEILEKVKKEEK